MARKPETKPTSRRTVTADDLKRVPWRCVGPANMGGRIADLCFKPGDTKTVYVAYATGGLWRTTNMGTTFAPLFDNEATSSIGSVACADAPDGWKGWKEGDDKKDAPGKIVWVGTGEGNGRNSSSWGNGVYRSTDGGKKWEHLGLADSHDIPRLAVDPRDPDVCYAAALGHLWGPNETRGLYKTTDGGMSWVKVLGDGSEVGCCDVILDPSDPETVYAALYRRRRTGWSYSSRGPGGGLFKSTDGGKTWKQMTSGLPSETGRVGFDVFPGDPRKLIACVEATDGGANSIRDDRMRGGGVFRSDDGGATWRRCSHRSPRAFYFSKVKFDPKDDNRVYMLGWTTEVSDDGGETFRGGVADILHADHHAILVNPDDSAHLIIGTDGGIYQSFDKGETWDFLNTMATGQFYNVALDDSDPYRIIGGLQDNGTWIGPSATHKQTDKDDAQKVPATGISNQDWLDVFWGDGFHAAFDPTDPDTVYAEWQGGHLTRLGLKDGSKRYCRPESREGEKKRRFNWNSPFFVSAHDPSVLYLGGNFVYRLTERGDKWTQVSPDLTTCDPARMDTDGSVAEQFCTLVALSESPVEKGVLAAGSDDGLVHVSRDDGVTWAALTPALVGGRYVSRLHWSFTVAGRLYMTVDGHRSDDMTPCVAVSDDYGATWHEIAADLPRDTVCKVARDDRANPEVLYLGTEHGLFVSLDRGGSWLRLHGKALPTVPVDDVQQHPRETDIVLGTHGRSVWVLDDAHWLAELTPEVASSPLHLFTIRAARPRWFLDYPGLWTHKCFRAPNPPALKIDYWVADYVGEAVEVVVKDAHDAVVKKLAGTGAPGFNRVTWDLVPEEWRKLPDKGEEPLAVFHVRPGTYKVELKMGDHHSKGTFELKERQ